MVIVSSGSRVSLVSWLRGLTYTFNLVPMLLAPKSVALLWFDLDAFSGHMA
jgi:hypothetical protein